MNRYFTIKYFVALMAVLLLIACQTIPEWDKAMIDNPIEDGRCPDLTGRFNYEHLGAKDTSEFSSILDNDLPGNLPTDRPTPSRSVHGDGPYHSARIYNKIHKGKFDSYPSTITVTLTRSDQIGRKYHVRVDWDAEGMLGEYDSAFDETWVCSSGNLFRSAKSTLHEEPNPDEIDPKDYRRIYVLPNGNIRIDRKHTYICGWNPGSCFARYYESRVFARVP
jgi:hypothetical protein